MTTRPLRVLAWPGMPAPEALDEAARRLGTTMRTVTVASNEALEALMDSAAPFDLAFPSDYLVERLRGVGRLAPLERAGLPLGPIAEWAVASVHDPGCAVSVPFTYGTTGFLCDPETDCPTTWDTLFAPPEGARVGMLAEVREVVGAALIAAGHSPNDTSEAALEQASALLERQRWQVARYNSDDFVGPVLEGTVIAHHAWSGPAAHAVRAHPGLRYVVPDEGAVLWVTTAAIPADAPDPELSHALLRELMDPDLLAYTTEHYGFATPNEAARRRLSRPLQADATLFPDEDTLRRCHVFRDTGPEEHRFADAWVRGVTDRR
jgi:spermidine/putrescine transport system substrate-binding protein